MQCRLIWWNKSRDLNKYGQASDCVLVRRKAKKKKRIFMTFYLILQCDNLFLSFLGDAFERDHWRSLFVLLKVPKDVTLETLKFGHLLDADKEILNKMNDLKDLAARA